LGFRDLSNASVQSADLDAHKVGINTVYELTPDGECIRHKPTRMNAADFPEAGFIRL
jgi:hypothetical protein